MYTRLTKKRPKFPSPVKAMGLPEALRSCVYIYRYKEHKAEKFKTLKRKIPKV